MRVKFAIWKRLAIILAVVGSLFSLNYWGGNEVKEGFFLFSSPLLNVSSQGGNCLSQKVSSIFSSQEGLARENQELRQDLSQLLYLEATNQQLREENWLLKKALLLQEEDGLINQPVQTITRNFAQDWILINKGEKEGIALNQPVVTAEKALVGKVAFLYSHSAKVELISHPGSVIEAEILQELQEEGEENSIRGLIQGAGGTMLSLELIPLKNPLEIGGVVIVSNLNPSFPTSFLIGKIQKIKKGNTQPFQEAEVVPFFLRQNLDDLFVISQF